MSRAATLLRALLLPLGLLPGGCSLTPSVAVTPRVGPLNIDGDLFVSASSTSASSDVDDLGFDDDDLVFEPRLDFGWGPLHIMATAYMAEYSGTGTASGQIDLGGVTISAGEPVDSALDITSVNVVGTFDFVPGDMVDVGIGLGARAIDFEGTIESLSTGQMVFSDETFAMPVAAARAAVGLGPVRVSLVGSGLGGSYQGIDASLIDLDLMGEYTFDELLGFRGSIVLGYRHIGVDVEYEEDGSQIDADLSFSGPYVGISLGI